MYVGGCKDAPLGKAYVGIRAQIPIWMPESNMGTFIQALYDGAKKWGWMAISRKNGWKRVFAFDK